MICPHCGTEIPDGSRFCLNCGKPLKDAALESHTEASQSQQAAPSSSGQQFDNSPSAENDSHSSEAKPMSSEEAAVESPISSSEQKQTSPLKTAKMHHAKVTKGVTTDSEPNDTHSNSPDNSGNKEQEQKNESSKHSKWLIVLICLVLPPIGMILLWRWRKNDSKLKKILVTALLCFLTVCYGVGIQSSVESAQRAAEINQEIASFSNLDATFQEGGLNVNYPGSWDELSKDETSYYPGDGKFSYYPGTNKAIGFRFDSTFKFKGDGAIDEYSNLSYKSGFDSFSNDCITQYRAHGYNFDDSTDQTQVLSNAMTRQISYTDSTNSGKIIIYSDSAGNAGELVIYANKDLDSNTKAMDVVSNIAASIEYTAPDYENDPTYNPVVSIEASYSGDTEEGTVLNQSNAGIVVTGTYADGTTGRVPSGYWKISTPQTLQAGQASTVTITADEASTDLTVQCTTMTEDQYKASCETVTYDELLRNPDSYKGKDIKLRGKVFQSVSGMILANVTQGNYGLWDDVTMVYWNGSPNVIEDDVATFWGSYAGTYTYTTAIGSQKTVPLLSAKYVAIE